MGMQNQTPVLSRPEGYRRGCPLQRHSDLHLEILPTVEKDSIAELLLLQQSGRCESQSILEACAIYGGLTSRNAPI